ncbi:glutamate racemase [Companilactobacillus ginsenosidimutans]|uniref:Glutamate racemase n=1 Tax=Companilactobacillus ginsenosidimutans TaxID=1007676 RepID=A0A0H4QIR7_9LACO|nr:glutamate racemase [Companilactobacillus ginsenosidimutans]AKP66911.1 glutamate racemase [Companilactobacillus ginsenosidimutans]
MSDKRPIGLLDSGVGGLTVVKQVIKQLPNEDVVFIGDEARMPYGVRPASEIVEFTREMVKFLISEDVKAIIYACNTATARAMGILQKEFDIPMFGVIKSGAISAINDSKSDDIGVIATKSTVDSGSYEAAIHAVNDHAKVISVAAQKFVEIVENSTGDTTEAKATIAETLAPFNNSDIDTLILGCTHFPMLSSQIHDVLGDGVQLVDPGIETARVTKQYLIDHNMLSDNSVKGKVELHTSADLDSFKKLAKDWLGDGITEINLVKLGD